MNKNLFRIIFNKRRGQLMAVGEISSSHGKGSRGEAVTSGHPVIADYATVALSTLSFVVLCAIGAVLWALPSPNAHAQVVAYRNAPGNQQPTILQTANGLPQINIQTPSAAGVSRNVYSQFDVQSNGVILNNSRTSVQTQQGGWVQGNPWLATGSARVILNEVNSSNPSQLNGYVEVAGQRAEVVIANPAGISVNGGGFINTSKATLTTGTPIVNGGSLDGYRVQGGSITINGNGLDLSTTDYAAILARAVQVNAGIWANELKVVTGANQIDASSLGANTTPVTTPIAGTGAVPSFALDVAQIGGMYAGKIYLIGTEQGLGVRSAGAIGSTGGDLVLQNNGWLTTTGALQASANLQITTQGDVTNSGTLYASNNQTLSATGNVTNSGKIQASNTLNLSASNISNTATGEISAFTTQTNASSALTNRGLIDGTDTQINANTINNIGTGRIYGDHLSIAATNLTNDTETLAGVTNAGTIAARDRLDLGISGTLTNREHALIYSVRDMAIGGAVDASRHATGLTTTLNNNSATIEAGGNLSLSSQTLNNTNDHFAYEIRVANVEVDVREDINSGLYRIFTRTTSLPYQTASDPAQILAGGGINLNSSNAIDYASHIVAGGTLNIGSSTLANTDVMATKSIRDVGTTHTLVHVPGSGVCGKIQINCVHAHDEWQTGPYDSTATSTVVVAQVTAARNSDTNVASRTNSSLYKNNPSLTSAYLIETDTRFIDRSSWLGSDFMTKSLGLDPTVTQKRLGDGFYEQKLIREQVAELTGRRFLADYTSDEQEYKALMSSAITFAQTYNLRPGIALTAQQIAQLTSDIVWLVEKSVTLPDGSSQKVLVPQLYVKVQPGDLDGSGALLAGKDVNINLRGDLTNSGTIAGRNVVSLTAENVNNLGGRIGGNDVSVAARQDLNNIGGRLQAVNSLSATAERDLNIQTTTQSSNTQVGSANFSRTGIDRVAGLYVSGADGTLVASAGRDLNLVAGVVSNAGSGATSLSAVNNLNLKTVQTGEQNNIKWNADNHLNYGNTQEVGSQVAGGGSVKLSAGNDVNARAANVQATGALSVNATGSVDIVAGQNTSNLDEAHKTTSGGAWSSSTLVTREVKNTSTSQASNFGGATVDINAGKDIAIKGSNVIGDGATTLTATNNVTIEAAQNTNSSSSFRKESSSGLGSSGGLSISYGDKMQSTDSKQQGTTAAASTVGSVGGNVNITAGEQYKQVGSDVVAPGGDISIQAKTVDIVEARQTGQQSTEQKFEQTAISAGLKGGIIDTIQATTQAVEAAQNSSNTRNRNLNALTAYAKGSNAYEQGIAVANAYDKNGVMGNTGADGKANPGAAAASGIKVSISIGSSKSQSSTSATSNTAAGSTVKAGSNVSIHATEQDLTAQGSNVQAGDTVALKAAKDVNIVASADTESNRSTNSSSSTSVGVSFGVGAGGGGFSVDIAASRGKGQANSDSTTYNNSHITGGNAVNITSGGDTTLKGGNVAAKQVTADVGGSLNVESLQDKANSAASQSTTGIAMSIPIGAGSGSLSYSDSKQKSDSNYASVNEQSGIKAREGGFQINVGGNTDLKGATIAGSTDASKNTLTTGTLTTSDISNSMSASASSSGVSVGTNMMDGKYAMAKGVAGNLLNNGSANQSDASTTTTAISAGTITVGKKTTDTSKEQLKDSNGKAVSADTTNTNRTLAKADVAGLQKSAQEQQASNMLILNTAVAFADPAFKAAFLDQSKMYKKVVDAKGDTSWQEMTPEEKAKIPPGSRIANNGIFNGGPDSPEGAQKLADQNSSKDAQYLVHFPQANNAISELLVAGYQKFLEGGTLGLTNATQQNVDLWNQTGGNVTLDGHSRGSMTVGNALDAEKEQGGKGGATNANLFGSAYNAQDAANTVNQLTDGAGKVKQSTNNYDFIGRILGGNAGTGGTIPEGSSVLEEALRTMGGAATVHNCYGAGREGCSKRFGDDYVAPPLVPVAPSNTVVKP